MQGQPSPQRRPDLGVWPPEIEALRRAIEVREAAASFVTCDPARAERLRQEARLLSGRLERLKVAILAAETAA